MKRIACRLSFLLLASSPSLLSAAEEWEAILQQGINSEYSQTRHDAVKQVDTKTAKGLKALWSVLGITNPDIVDWYVREGAYEALTAAEGDEAEAEVHRLLTSKSAGGGGPAGEVVAGSDLAKEAVVYSVIWKIRKAFIKVHGENDDRKIEEAKQLLRKTRGVQYFALVLPILKEFDPKGKRLEWIRLAFADKQSRVRRAAIVGFLAYPDNSSVPLLIENLKKIEKRKAANYREWVLNRHALEVLTGQNFRESVEDWARWWDISQKKFSIEKRVEEEAESEGEDKPFRTTVVKDGVEVQVNMKVAGLKTGYPLLVLPWDGYESDYFRPYFHGIENFMRVYYVQMPSVDDFKGLKRDEKSNLVIYPTQILAGALGNMMKESGLEKFAVLAHGPESCVAAMFTAAAFPQKVTQLVLINPRSAGTEYSEAIANVRKEGGRRKNREITKGADYITRKPDGTKTYEPADSAEAGGLGRALYNLRFADPTSPEVGMMQFFYDLPSGTGQLADHSWSVRNIFNNKKPNLPVMVVMGELDPWTPVPDMLRVANFLGATVAKFPNSTQSPFMSETYAFTQQMEKFFAKVKSVKKDGKAEGQEKDKGKDKEKKTKTAKTVAP